MRTKRNIAGVNRTINEKTIAGFTRVVEQILVAQKNYSRG
jgi:hypothetical protein